MPRKLNKDEIINRFNHTHKNKYDYSLVEYANINTKVKIICQQHGVFEQTPKCHIRGDGCPNCSKNKKMTLEKFIKKSKAIYGGKYDYSLVEYKNNKTKVKIICPEHGVFEQTPHDNLSGHACCVCGGSKKLTQINFIKKSNKIHDNKYDYSLVEYKNNKTKVKIICPEHGVFEQIPKSHLNGNGCPNCVFSKGENIVYKYLLSNEITFEKEKTFKNCKNVRKLPFDFFIPELNLCIEYDGIHHFEPRKYFGGEKTYIKRKELDKIKTLFCENNNINLLRIKYTEINNINNILDDYFKKKTNVKNISEFDLYAFQKKL